MNSVLLDWIAKMLTVAFQNKGDEELSCCHGSLTMTGPVSSLQLPTKRHKNVLIISLCDKLETGNKNISCEDE